MFYWIYTKKNETKPIISRNFPESKDAVKFALRNGKDWKHGDMLKNGERYGEFHKGKIRIGSKIESSVKPKAPKKKVASNCDVVIRDRAELLQVLRSLETTSAKWKHSKENPLHMAGYSGNYPIIIHVRRNVLSWTTYAINGANINTKIR